MKNFENFESRPREDFGPWIPDWTLSLFLLAIMVKKLTKIKNIDFKRLFKRLHLNRNINKFWIDLLNRQNWTVRRKLQCPFLLTTVHFQDPFFLSEFKPRPFSPDSSGGIDGVVIEVKRYEMTCTRMNKDVQRLTRFRIVNYKRALCGLIFLTFVHTEFFRPSSNIWIRLFQIELDHLRSLDLMIVRMTRSFKLNCTIFLNLTVRLNCRILGSYDSHIQACDRIIQKIWFLDDTI